MKKPVVHLWHARILWCGSMGLYDKTTTDPSKATCPRCLAALRGSPSTRKGRSDG